MHFFDRCTRALGATALLVIAALVAPAAADGAEIGAAHLVYEKPVKLKKLEATLYLSYADQATKSDPVTRARRVECAVAVVGTRKPLTATGRVELRLLGAVQGSGAAWRSSSRSAEVDADGQARLDAAAILELASEAEAARAEPELIAIAFSGGKGKKVSTVTIDCLREPDDE
jgi:hypothetical protein